MNNNKKIELDIDAKINAAQAETDLRKLTRQLRDLRSELENIDETSADFNRLRDSISEVESKIGDANDRLKTITGEPLERVNNGLSLVSEGLMNLDFDKATIGINGIADGIGKMNLSKMQEGIGKVATAFANLGKVLLTNPIFLLGAAIAGLVVALYKLKDLGGSIGMVFNSIGKAIDSVKKSITDFTDMLGLTDTKSIKFIENLKYAEEGVNNLGEAFVNIDEAGGFSSFSEQLSIMNREVSNLENNLNVTFATMDNITEKSRKKVVSLALEYINLKETIGLIDPDGSADRYKAMQDRIIEIAKSLGDILSTDDIEKLLSAADKLIQGETKQMEKIATKSNELIMKLVDNHYKLVEESADNIQNLRNKELKQAQINGDKRREIEIQTQVKMIEDAEASFNAQQKMVEEDSDTWKNLENSKRLIREKLYEKDGKTLKLLTLINEEERKKIRDINLKYDKIELADRIKNNELKKSNIMNNEVTTNKEKISLLETYYSDEKKLITNQYDLQIKEAAGNAEKIKALEEEKKLSLEAIEIDKTNTYKRLRDEDVKGSKEAADKKLQIEIELAERIKEARAKQLNDLATTLESELTTLQSHQQRVLVFRLNAEKTLIEEIARARKDANRLAMEEELANIDKLKKDRLAVTVVGSIAEGAIIAETENQKDIVRKKYAQKDLELNESVTDQKLAANEKMAKKAIQLAQYGMDIANSLAEYANLQDEKHRDEQGNLDLEFQKRIFERNKNFQYANAIMNTAAAVTGALSSSAGANWPAAIAAGIAGAVQIAKIAATKFTPEGGASTGGGGSTNITAPQMAETPKNPFFSQGYMNQNIGPNGMSGFRPGKDNNMIKVGVYESDIRSVMNKVNVLETRSTLSGAGN